MNTQQESNIYKIGTAGNQVEIDYLGKGEYRLIFRDHYSENFVDYYVDEGTLRGLAEFINHNIISTTNCVIPKPSINISALDGKWNHVRPIVGFDKDSIQEIIISEYEKSQKNIQPVWIGEGWYKTTPNSFNYFASGFEAGIEFSKQQKENN